MRNTLTLVLVVAAICVGCSSEVRIGTGQPEADSPAQAVAVGATPARASQEGTPDQPPAAAQQDAPKQETEPTTAPKADPQTIEVFALDDEGEPQSKGRAAPGDLSTAALAEHISVLSRQISVRNVELLIDLLPHALRYDVQEGRVICPYSMIMQTLCQWTPIDGAKTYDPVDGRLRLSPKRHFVLLHAHGRDARQFDLEWLESVASAAEDIEYCRQWLAKRRGALEIGRLGWWKATPASASGGPDSPGVFTPGKVEFVPVSGVVFDPRFDACKTPPQPDPNRPTLWPR